MSANIARLLEESARRWPDKPVLRSEDAALDWAALERRAGGVARALADQGVGPGDRVALTLADPAEVVVALFGALKVGATVAPLNQRLTAEEQRQIVADLDPACAIDALDDGAEADFPAREVDASDAAIVLYTSGSTGEPKGVLLSHAATAFALESWRGPVMDLGPSDVALSALPLAHSLGIFGSVLAPLLSGGSVVFVAPFSPEAALEAVARAGVTAFPGVATMFRRIVDCPAVASADTSSLRYALSGAAPCPWELASAWTGAVGARIVRGYGMTELFRPISYRASDPRDEADSIGRAVPDVTLRVVDEDGRAVGAREMGELWIRSPARMTGYLNKPDATRAVLDGDWFKTGDLATVSEDGFVRIVGRKKDVVLRGGYTVAAGEVETALKTHPEIADAAVIGVPDSELGEEIAAFVVLRPGTRLAASDIVAYCKGRMSSHKYPRQVRIVADLPVGPTGKVIKGRLRL